MVTASPKNHVGLPERNEWFDAFARKAATTCGKPVVFIAAVLIVVAWAATGPLFDYSDTWQLVINTGTTIVTFLMVFLIQNTQNRDTLAVQVKLAELIIAVQGAQNRLANAEDLSEEELTELHEEYRNQADAASQALTNRREKKKSSAASANKKPKVVTLKSRDPEKK
jgi:low affinity Fe/Cu permease